MTTLAIWRDYYDAYLKSGLTIADFYSIVLPEIIAEEHCFPALKTVYNQFAYLKHRIKVFESHPELLGEKKPKPIPDHTRADQAFKRVRAALESHSTVKVIDLSGSDLEQAFAALANIPLSQLGYLKNLTGGAQ